MKKKTKLIIGLALFVIIAGFLIFWLVAPSDYFTQQTISYETFLDEEEAGNIRAIYFSASNNTLYGIYQRSTYAVDQLPKRYDFTVEGVDRDELTKTMQERLDDQPEEDLGWFFHKKSLLQ